MKIQIILFVFITFFPFSFFPSNLTDNGDGTVSDADTGLTWQKSYVSDNTWEDALKYCEELSFANLSDWRLPNINELITTVDYSKTNSAIDTNYFTVAVKKPGKNVEYWSSTTNARDTVRAFGVDFYYGGFLPMSKTVGYYVRCVRG